MLAPTLRFSDRVTNYIKYRPSYPPEVIATLEHECGLRPEHIVADIGSGTGILTELFLKHGNVVFGVEPNEAMRGAAEALLCDYAEGTDPHLWSFDGTAEATTLPAHSVDFVVAGQAFHWFDVDATRLEFERILRPAGWVALIWNRRERTGNPFQDGYEDLLRQHSPEYEQVHHDRIDASVLTHFFAPHPYDEYHFPNFQEFDLEALKGRALSSSYAPLEGQAGHKEMMAGLEELFEQFQQHGKVRFNYNTQVICGHFPPSGNP